MPCIPWDKINRAPKRTAVPFEMAPRFWMENAEVVITSVSTSALGATLCKPNPERFMVGFACRTNSDVKIFPRGGSVNLVEELDATFHDRFAWFSIFNFGPLPMLEWVGVLFPAVTVEVYQVLRLNR